MFLTPKEWRVDVQKARERERKSYTLLRIFKDCIDEFAVHCWGSGGCKTAGPIVIQ